MIATVSTVMDSLPNVQRFVSRNLAAGADHMFVFLDAADAEVAAFLEAQPHVTLVDTSRRRYWQGRRPGGLNVRQTVNANRVRVLLAPFGWADWLFHIDGDECLDLDREQLLALDRSVPAVRLDVLEAVSVADGGGEEVFKRLLGPDELALLHLLGLVEQPRNGAYFNGYTHGKSGIRPSLDYNLRIHRAKTDDEEVVAPFEADFLHVLHYDSSSAEEFVRKWSAHVSAAYGTVFGPKKQQVRAAVTAVVSNPALSEERKRHYLLELYRRHVEDDVAALDDLGLLVRPAPEHHRYQPQPMTRHQEHDLRVLLEHLLDADQGYFRPAVATHQPARLLQEVAGRLSWRERGLARQLEACVERSAAGRQPA